MNKTTIFPNFLYLSIAWLLFQLLKFKIYPLLLQKV